MSKFKTANLRGEEWPYIAYENGDIYTQPNRYNGHKQKKLKPVITHNGYHRVTLSKNGRSAQTPVHRIIAETFISPHKTGMYVNHKDCNKLNNSVENLEWVTSAQNTHHAIFNGKLKSNVRPEVVNDIRNNYKKHGDGIAFARKYKISRACVSFIKNNKTWKE
jgi:hypothetical protein